MQKAMSQALGHAQSASSVLQSVISSNLAQKLHEEALHVKLVAKNQKQAEIYKKRYNTLIKKAVRGANNLVSLHKSQEFQEIIRIIREINGHKAVLSLHTCDVDLEGEFLAWTHSRCHIFMTQDNVMLHVTGQFSGSGFDHQTCFNDPSDEGEGYETLAEAIEHCCLILKAVNEKAVEAVNAIDVFTECKNDLNHFLSWFAFLVACSDQQQLAKIVDNAFKRVSH